MNQPYIQTYLQENICATKESGRNNLQHVQNGDRHLIATNGHILVEIDLSVYPKLKDVGMMLDTFPNYKKVIPDRTTEGWPSTPPVIPIQKLQIPEEKIIEKDKTIIPCPSCDGGGQVDHTCNCEHCDTLYEKCSICSGQGSYEKGQQYRSYCQIGNYIFRAIYINAICGVFTLFDIKKISLFQKAPEPFEYPSTLFTAKGIQAVCMPIIRSHLHNETDLMVQTITEADLNDFTRNPKIINQKQ